MPTGVIRGPYSETAWKRAKEAAAAEYPGVEQSDPNKYYAIVMTIYKAICKKHGCKPANESRTMSEHLEYLQALSLEEGALDLTFDDAMEELFDQATEQDGKLSRLDIGKELRDIGKNSAKYMKKAIAVLKGLGVKIVAR